MMRFPLTIEQHRPPSRREIIVNAFWFVFEAIANMITLAIILAAIFALLWLVSIAFQMVGVTPEG